MFVGSLQGIILINIPKLIDFSTAIYTISKFADNFQIYNPHSILSSSHFKIYGFTQVIFG